MQSWNTVGREILACNSFGKIKANADAERKRNPLFSRFMIKNK